MAYCGLNDSFFVENNYNVCELGPRGTGKKPYLQGVLSQQYPGIRWTNDQANLFYNMSTRRIGLVGLWDLVAFDEVAGISSKDKDGVQIMKDYMASGSLLVEESRWKHPPPWCLWAISTRVLSPW